MPIKKSTVGIKLLKDPDGKQLTNCGEISMLGSSTNMSSPQQLRTSAKDRMMHIISIQISP